MNNIVLDFRYNYVRGERLEAQEMVYQYDAGRIVEAYVPEAEPAFFVHVGFENSSEALALIDDVTVEEDAEEGGYKITAVIPDSVLVKYGNLLIYVVGAEGDQIVTTYEGFVIVKHKEAAEDYIVPDNQAVNIIERAKAAAITAEASAQIAEAAAAEAMSGTPEGYAALVDTVETLSDTDNLTVGTARQLLSGSYQLDTVPYTFRRSGGGLSIGDRMQDEIVGGSIVRNQLADAGLTAEAGWRGNGVRINVHDGEIDVISTTDSITRKMRNITAGTRVGHVFLLSAKVKTDGVIGGSVGIYATTGVAIASSGWKAGTDYESATAIGKPTLDTDTIGLRITNGATIDSYCTYKDVQVYDLTAMFGPTVADGIYTMEQETAGAGVAYFRQLFPEDYYEYDPGTLRSVEGVSAHTMRDADNHVIASYPLDSTLILRGVPKWVDGKLSFDGDVYSADGTVNRRYGVVDLGTLNWTTGTAGGNNYFRCAFNAKYGINAIASNGYKVSSIGVWNSSFSNKTIALSTTNWSSTPNIAVRDDSYPDVETFKSAMNGVMLEYELATPTTETAQPYQEIQQVDPDGTEEYVTTGIVPVGHSTKYFANLREKLEALPSIPEPPTTDGNYTLKATVSDGTVAYVWEAVS